MKLDEDGDYRITRKNHPVLFWVILVLVVVVTTIAIFYGEF